MWHCKNKKEMLMYRARDREIDWFWFCCRLSHVSVRSPWNNYRTLFYGKSLICIHSTCIYFNSSSTESVQWNYCSWFLHHSKYTIKSERCFNAILNRDLNYSMDLFRFHKQNYGNITYFLSLLVNISRLSGANI